MAIYYHDTSAVVKRYRTEVGTAVINRLMGEPDAIHFISGLGPVEFKSALAKHVRMGDITKVEAQQLDQRFRFDVANGQLRVLRLLVRHLKTAGRLIDQYAPTHSLRTLDAIQLAVALDLHQHHRLDFFVCADTALCAIAIAEGLAVINPVTHTP